MAEDRKTTVAEIITKLMDKELAEEKRWTFEGLPNIGEFVKVRLHNGKVINAKNIMGKWFNERNYNITDSVYKWRKKSL